MFSLFLCIEFVLEGVLQDCQLQIKHASGILDKKYFINKLFFCLKLVLVLNNELL